MGKFRIRSVIGESPKSANSPSVASRFGRGSMTRGRPFGQRYRQQQMAGALGLHSTFRYKSPTFFSYAWLRLSPGRLFSWLRSA